MANGRNGGGGRKGVIPTALAAVLVATTACAVNAPTAPRTAGLDKWDGEPVVEKQQTCASGQAGPACAPIRASAP